MAMTPFLKYIAEYINQHHPEETGKVCIVLPNKRGALYLKQHLAAVFQKTIWLPAIISAEELVSELSGLRQADGIDLICELYQAYTVVLKEKAEPFDAFAKWGNLMLQDFNEADRYLVDTKALYQNLKEIREIENWSLNAGELTETQQEYCNFMHQMGEIYEVFSKTLLENKHAYQGLMYRKAVERYLNSAYIERFSHIVIAGFNALNKAETIIFSELVKTKKASILWDADHYYLDNEAYEAGLFLRRNFANAWLDTKTLISDGFREIPKQIDIVAVPKQSGQAQVVAKQLKQWMDEGKSLSKTAIVLADESLLFPVLSQLPEAVQHVNITMEYPLKFTAIYDLVDHLITLHLSVQKSDHNRSFYYSDVFRIIQNPLFKLYYATQKQETELQGVIEKIIDKNYVWINTNLLSDLFGKDYPVISSLFERWNSSETAIEAIAGLITVFNANETLTLNATEKEYLHVFTKYFNRLQALIQTHDYLNSLQTLKSLYRQIVGTASVPFIGEPLKGLQIMGVLETRTLDFEHVMLLGVNEGVLPSGKSANSFIPNDLKRYHGMPLYGDKDAIYAYHFYRLLQRASDVLISYNTEQSVLGSGEKSRFITQLQFELGEYHPQHVITERMLSGSSLPASKRNEITIESNDTSVGPVLKKVSSAQEYGGLSPSALITYKDCALRFFFRYSAGMKETNDVEENAEANTQGTILHESLERLYTPYKGRVLTVGDLSDSQRKAVEVVGSVFQNYFTQAESRFGKNFLQRKVLGEYVNKLLRNDLKTVQRSATTGEYLTIIDLEKKLSADFVVKYKGNDVPVFMNGSADRIDRLGAYVRIIDYKSSVKDSDKFRFTGFEELFNDSQYNKMLQLFMYAWLAVKNNIAKPEELQPCIIPFRKFEETPRYILDGTKKNEVLVFTNTLLDEFEQELVRNVEKILHTPFSQTPDTDQCLYCAYAAVCNIS